MKRADRIKILKELKEKLRNSSAFYSNYPQDDNIDNFIWVGTKNKIIGEWDCHYEFIFNEKEYGNPNYLSLEVHLCENDNGKYFKELLLGDEIEFSKWYNEKTGKDEEKGRILFVNQAIKYNTPGIVPKSMQLLEKMHNAIGQQLLEIIQTHSELLPKKLQNPKLLKHSRTVVTKKEYSARTEKEAKSFNSKHGEILNKLEVMLTNEKKYKLIIKEQGFENRNYQIDLLAQKKDGHYDIYEVKPYPTATQCIREALGQLLFYKYLLEKGEYTVDTLYIVGAAELSEQEKEFIESITDSLDNSVIKIRYYQVK